MGKLPEVCLCSKWNPFGMQSLGSKGCGVAAFVMVGVSVVRAPARQKVVSKQVDLGHSFGPGRASQRCGALHKKMMMDFQRAVVHRLQL